MFFLCCSFLNEMSAPPYKGVDANCISDWMVENEGVYPWIPSPLGGRLGEGFASYFRKLP